jgi:hypothetical protein
MYSKLRILIFCICVLSPALAKADFELLPESRHLQYQTYGLYIDQQSMLIYRDSGRGWGAVGGEIALVGNDDWKYKPQLVVHASANAAYQINAQGNTLLTQTIDARVGLALDFTFTDKFRGAIIWTHQSGHVADNVPDLDLFGSNLGNEVIDFRFIRDIDTTWRLGGGIRPTVGSDPGMVVLGAEEFAEYFPLGEGLNPHQFKPFAAVGFEQYGREEIRWSSNVEIGMSAGSHFPPVHHAALRVVLGYYNGNDPRLKYYQFKNSRQAFAYGGLEFDI